MNSNRDLSEFDLSDLSSSDDSNIEDLLHDLEDDNEATLLLLAVKELEDHARLLGQRCGSVMGRVSIERNRALGHATLMDDYFAEVPTYPVTRVCPSGTRGLVYRARPIKEVENYKDSKMTWRRRRKALIRIRLELL
jgi:hypothetical protein